MITMPLDIIRTSQLVFVVVGCLLLECFFSESREYYRRYNVGVKSGKNSDFDENLVSLDPPEFDTLTAVNITVERGHPAFLHCKVKNQGTNVVSWVRYTPSFNVITISDQVFIKDRRFAFSRKSDSSDWTIRLANVQQADAGIYECQIGTDPKMGRNITLHVVDALFQSDSQDTKPRTRTTGDEVARAVIKGDRETQVGQSLNLTCVIASSQPGPANNFIKWHHNDTTHVNYDASTRSGHQVEIYRSPTGMFSRLFVRHSHASHAGKYTCSAKNAEPAVVIVQVHPSTQPVALKRDSGNAASAGHSATIIRTIYLFSFLLIINSRIKL